MVVLGISGRAAHAAAAVVVDGSPIAAVGEAELTGRPDFGYRLTGGLPPRATGFGLERTQAAGRSVSLVALVDERRWLDTDPRDIRRTLPLVSLNGQRIVRVGAGHAAAALTAAAMPHGAGLIVIIDRMAADAGGIFRKQDGAVQYRAPIRGAGLLTRAACIVARALGVDEESAVETLAELGASDGLHVAESAQEFGGAFDRALRHDLEGDGGVRFDEAALRAVLERAAADSPGALTTANHPHREVQRRRRAIAAALVDREIEIVAAIASAAARNDPSAATAMGFGGSFFVSPRINTRLAETLADSLGRPTSASASPASHVSHVTFSPVPEPVGLALGAALAVSTQSAHAAAKAPLRHLGLGPSFGEDEIKETLENCRIDYVYEPDQPRLTARASQLLARGKVVAWFHGALDFGPRSLGARSILCDPSNRYARHNINEYLLRRPLDAPLAVSMPAESAADVLDTPLTSPFMLLRGQVREDRAEPLRAALDTTRACAIHTIDRPDTRANARAGTAAAELHALLTAHAAATGVPGLIHCPLRALDTPTAATPRDAIGSLFTSAIDAIVISRFLVMKDYWLLRSAL
jgi:hypothetical protein